MIDFIQLQNLVFPTIDDLKHSAINFNDTCNYLQEKNGCCVEAKQHISDLITYCRKIILFIYSDREEISSFNHKAHNILTNEILSILPKFLKTRKEKRGIITLLISGSIGLAYEGISSFLPNRRHKALQKHLVPWKLKYIYNVTQIIHLEDSMMMYGIYNAETLENLINMVYQIHKLQKKCYLLVN